MMLLPTYAWALPSGSYLMGTVLGYGSLIVARPIQANPLGAREDRNERREMKRKREKSHDQT